MFITVDNIERELINIAFDEYLYSKYKFRYLTEITIIAKIVSFFL